MNLNLLDELIICSAQGAGAIAGGVLGNYVVPGVGCAVAAPVASKLAGKQAYDVIDSANAIANGDVGSLVQLSEAVLDPGWGGLTALTEDIPGVSEITGFANSVLNPLEGIPFVPFI